VKEIELRLIAEEAGFVDGQVLEQGAKFSLAFMTGQQAVIAVKSVETTGFQPPVQAVVEEVSAALVKIHAALLINQGLQQLKFGFSDLNLNTRSGHWSPRIFSVASSTSGGRGRSLSLGKIAQPPQLALL
jgi:hypothetical protein